MSSIEEFRTRVAELRVLAKTMDLPADRKEFETIHDVLWFVRNASIKNEKHPNIKQAMSLAVSLSTLVK